MQAHEQQAQATPMRAAQIRAMFDRIVPRYDLMNRVMTAGMDGRWRRRTAAAAAPQGALVLDLGTGTGDLAHELRRAGARRVIAADFARLMLMDGRRKKGLGPGDAVTWVQADALRLPFADESFDAVTSGFLLRNLVDLPAGFVEMVRMLKPGGRLVALDITHPPPGPLGASLQFSFNRIVAPLAGALSGDRAAYRYLSGSLAGFPPAPDLAAIMEGAGLVDVGFNRLGLGAMALHRGRKPLPA